MDVNTDGKFQGLLLGALLESVVVIEIDKNEGTEIGFWGKKVLDTKFKDIYIFSLGTYDGTNL